MKKSLLMTPRICLCSGVSILVMLFALLIQVPTAAHAITNGSDDSPSIDCCDLIANLERHRKPSPFIPDSFLDITAGDQSGCNALTAFDWSNMMWQTFIALNWPHDSNGIGGQPLGSELSADDWQLFTIEEIFDRFNGNYTDPNNYPDTVFWTYNTKRQLLIEESGLSNEEMNPGPWENPVREKPEREYMGESYRILGSVSKFSRRKNRLDQLFNTATIHRPLIDRNGNFVLYQIFINKKYWDYVRDNRYYDAAYQTKDIMVDCQGQGQPDDCWRGDDYVGQSDLGFKQAPLFGENMEPDWLTHGIISLKVAWRQLNATEANSGRYYTRKVYFENNGAPSTDDVCGDHGAPVTIGMVGFHIFRGTADTGPHNVWAPADVGVPSGQSGFWATFEHVDNVNGTAPSFNSNCQDAPSGYTIRGTCIDAVPNYNSTAWPENGPPPNASVTSNYPGGLCGPQSADNISQIFRIPESKANLSNSNTTTVNTFFQNYLAGTPFQYYQLVQTIQPLSLSPSSCTGGAPPPTDGFAFIPPLPSDVPDPWAGDRYLNISYMTNTVLEPYSQYNFLQMYSNGETRRMAPISSEVDRNAMNCITCHSMAKPVPGKYYNSNHTQEPSYVGRVPYGSNDRSEGRGMQIMSFLLGQAATSCPADINLDSVVDAADLLNALEGWGDCNEPFCAHDVNQDDVIDIEDVLLILNKWGECIL